MKFFLPLALLAAAVSAQQECAAEVIVQTCLESEGNKFKACGATDYDCQCAAQQAISTCYNNCPGDSRKTEAEGQVSIYCGNASLYGNKATQKAATPTGNSAADSTDAPEASPTQGSDKSSTGDAAASETSKGGAAELAMNAGGVLLAVAGVMAVIV
ncbi:hypothetical protein SAPIO_CDS2676 [Scedosporium apiospermum]|uniref:GPI anchored serine-threonine rich protein n=1 Tax=Pseudallescheria apiosperma TaxID=563466 RepID=A0A084GD00_PSEDA|nr:uncharacterized protein SAPIO_CDS2676 [Scedosporium apiospermum]KEZ45212.1 hypothetical protein SAPIO_CDS2676 [Scedosporium apiospermum]